jgi:predicted amidohydrolase
VSLGGVRCGINICADIWEEGAAERARAGRRRTARSSSTPRPAIWKSINSASRCCASGLPATGIPAIYVNLVGGQDELVFDGASFALDAEGDCRMRLPQFEEALGIVDYDAGRLRSGDMADELSVEAEAYRALVLGVRDYIGKSGFRGASSASRGASIRR